jgi:radical SAM superfamily enzyme YgiQ (UPF0313 family)
MFPARAVREAEAVLFYLPMHTATRMAVAPLARVRELNPRARIACYGLYAPLNRDYLLGELGVDAVFGGEYEPQVVQWALRSPAAAVSLDRLQFLTPDRAGLPVLNRYAQLRTATQETRITGYTEASRGCKHRCRHCPVVPVYDGSFRIVQTEIVLADIRQQVREAGAQHITFGDPDFWNGPSHAARILEAFRREFPDVTYDVTIKVEHLLRHRQMLPLLKETGCAFVTSAVESLDDEVLRKLDKGHTRADFLRVVEEFRHADLALSPTFIAFHPWTTIESYRDFLTTLHHLELVESVSPVQLALRLLLPAGSRMLELAEIRDHLVQDFDSKALTWRWRHAEPEVDRLGHSVFQVVSEQPAGQPRTVTFARVWELVFGGAMPPLASRATIPYLTEPWYC